MKKKVSTRGIVRYEFEDYSEQKCSMHKSNHKECDCVCLGIEGYRLDAEGKKLVDCTMHISRKLAAKLALKLAAFAERGDL